MGNYIYRVTAKIVDTPVGKANVAKFAYKPWGWDMAANARLEFKTGCVASERMFRDGKPTRLVALVDPNTGEIETVFLNAKRMATFSDHLFGQADCLPAIYTNDAGAYVFTARRETGELTLYGHHYSIEPNGRWVVRNQYGHPIDVDQYRNDLAERYPGLIIEDAEMTNA